MKTSLVHLSLALLLSVSMAPGGTTGKLAGRVTDRQTGEPLIGANVAIPSLSIGASTDIEGYYHIINIPPGQYEATIAYVGYSRSERRVSIQVDQTTTLDVALTTTAVDLAEVVVVAERVVVQRDQSSTVQRASAEDLQALPVNSVTAVLQLQTGVVNTGQLHVRGGRSGEVGYYLDGYRVEDPLFNSAGIEVNNQAIQEMELLSGTFNAEYGNALSGVVNIVTKENTERYHAKLSYKRTKLGIEEASNNLNERYVEGIVSGPLWSSSPVGFLLSGKKVDADNYYSSGATQLTSDGLGHTRYESIEFSRVKPFGFNDYLSLVGKISWAPFSSAKVTLLENYSKRKWQTYDHIMRFIPDSTYLRSSQTNLLGLNFRHSVSRDLFYDVRLSYYRYTFLRSVNGWSPDQYTFPSFHTFDNSLFYSSMASTVYEDQSTHAYDARGDMTWQIDRFHLVKGGVELKASDLEYYYIANPVNPTDQTTNIYRKKPLEGSAYLQDKIEFETIILNLGLRFDFFDASTPYRLDPFDPASTANTKSQTSISPRVGIAYPVRENMVFHFAYGQFFQKPEYQALYDNLDRVFNNRRTLFGTPSLKAEKTSSYELGLHTSLGTSTSVQLTFFSKKIQNLIGVVWNYDRSPYAYYLNEDFATAKGFEVSTRARLHNISFVANYTFSVAKGSSSTQQERFSGAFNIIGKQSLRFLPLDFDQKHTGNAQLSLDFRDGEGPFGFLPSVFENFTCTFIAQYGSGLPYTFNPARAIYVAEPNNSRLPARFSVDLYARKGFSIGAIGLGVFADVRNLLNRKNVVSVYSTTGSPTVTADESIKATQDYQQDPTNFASPRTIYVGVEIEL